MMLDIIILINMDIKRTFIISLFILIHNYIKQQNALFVNYIAQSFIMLLLIIILYSSLKFSTLFLIIPNNDMIYFFINDSSCLECFSFDYY